MDRPSPSPPPSEDHLLGCLARVVWLAAAPAALFLVAFLLAESRSVAGVSAHLVLPLVLAAAVAVRWADVTLLGGRTTEGEPATTADVRRYALTVVGIGIALWALAAVAAHFGWLT